MKTVIYNQRGLEISALKLKTLALQKPGIFETLRTYQGRLFCLPEHLERLRESAVTSGLRFSWSLGQIERILQRSVRRYLALPEADGDAFLRLMLWPGELYVLAGSRKHPDTIFREGVRLTTSVIQRPFTNAGAPQAKTHAYQNGIWAMLDHSGDAYEHLFLDAQGYVAEVSIGNLFIIKKGALLTPPVRVILNGVTRRFVIECALRSGIPVQERPLTRHEVFNADEAFLTNTSWEVLPVRELDGRMIGHRIPGSMTRSIHKQFKRKVLDNV